jgi:recombination protein RecT
MSNQIAVLNRDLESFRGRFQQALPPSTITVNQLIQTVVFCCERTPRLFDCTRESLFQSALTAANLGLVVDGVTGQGYLIPRKESASGLQKAQFQIGYKGVVSLAGRSSWIITAHEVRENDPFRIIEGSEGCIQHEIVAFTKALRGKVIGAYAIAKSKHFPSAAKWMSLDEIFEIRNKSAAFASNPNRSVWTTDTLSMILKTPMLALGKRLPLELVNKAAVLEEQADIGRFSYIDGGQVIVEGEAYPVEQPKPEKPLDERVTESQEKRAPKQIEEDLLAKTKRVAAEHTKKTKPQQE